VFAQLASELRADAVVLGIDLGHGYRHETFRTTENLPDNLAQLAPPALRGYPCHARQLSCGLARRREAPRSRIALLRAPGKPDFDAGCRKRLALLLPFVDHAIALACALETSQRIARGTRTLLDETGKAMLLLAADGRVVQTTVAARTLLEAAGARLDDRLNLPDPRLQTRYETLLRQLHRHPPGTRLHLELHPGLRIALHKSHTQTGLLNLAVICATGPGPRVCDFARQYRLTPGELKLCQALASGSTLKECACRWNRAYETLRGQLKTVFSKTGCQRQIQLVALYRAHVVE
jgi:DNA-binding CsgD family transcriptional regulator